LGDSVAVVVGAVGTVVGAVVGAIGTVVVTVVVTVVGVAWTGELGGSGVFFGL
jgi:hypothetical protein